MVNFYEELNLPKSCGLTDINKELSRLESTWKRREITNPERATKMLALIIDARKHFKTDASRAEYDRFLHESTQKPVRIDPITERKAAFDKWYSDARQFKSINQNDLAKAAIEKAMSFLNPNSDDPEFLSFAAKIYRDNKDYLAALNYINKAIVASPNVSIYYIDKAFIIERQALAAQQCARHAEAADFFNRERETIQIAISKANSSGDKHSESVALGMMAFACYYFSNPDKVIAEQYAKRAVALGDDWGNGQKVLDEIKRVRDEQRTEIIRTAPIKPTEPYKKQVARKSCLSIPLLMQTGLSFLLFLSIGQVGPFLLMLVGYTIGGILIFNRLDKPGVAIIGGITGFIGCFYCGSYIKFASHNGVDSTGYVIWLIILFIVPHIIYLFQILMDNNISRVQNDKENLENMNNYRQAMNDYNRKLEEHRCKLDAVDKQCF